MGRSDLQEPEEIALETSDRSQLQPEDPRLELVGRVVASRRFARSALLSNFLLYIATETIEGRANRLSEHQIGVSVFDRPRSYRTVEDNIVRSYARQLRRRLNEFFEDEGSSETMRIDIPLGGYVPRFTSTNARYREAEEPVSAVPSLVDSFEPSISEGRSDLKKRLTNLLLLALYTAAIFCSSWWLEKRINHPRTATADVASSAATPLWNALLSGPRQTYVVPSDAGLNLIEDISHRPVPLASYIAGGYSTATLSTVDAHSASDLRTQHFTSFVDLQITAALWALPEFNPQRAILRFPRDVRVDDLKHANAIILGSEGSNPWASIADSNANFRISFGGEMQGATVINSHPTEGEVDRYESHWNEPAHETYALISYLPNLEGDGRLLILQGLDVAGTQAAAEVLIHPFVIEPILRRAVRPDGSIRYFEILLRTTSIESNAMNTHVVGSRMY